MSKKTDRFKLLCDFSELNWVFSQSADLDSFLHQIVTMVAKHLNAGSCSIFLWEEESETLVLRATKGLNPEFIGKLRLKLGEGLTGLALEELHSVCVREARKHPRFKFIPGAFEERFDSFMAVPIQRGIEKIGVITIRRGKDREFHEEDVQALRVIASQLANILENARLLMQLHPQLTVKPHPKTATLEDRKFIQGTSASRGQAAGKVLVLDRDRSVSQLLDGEFAADHTVDELRQALTETEKQLDTLQKKVEEKLDDAASLIFTSHLLLLKDQEFIGEIFAAIEDGLAPARALLTVFKRYIGIFSQSPNPLIREKVVDLEDLVLRILSNLDPEGRELIKAESRVVIARSLFPSDILKLSAEKAAGIVLVRGGATSHTSILATSLGLPLVIADVPELMDLSSGTEVLVDADKGQIHLNPDRDLMKRYRKSKKAASLLSEQPTGSPETYTVDGTRIRLLANINLVSDLKLAMKANAEGVGLYRTEYPFLIRSDFPAEEEQFIIYRKAVSAGRGLLFTFRTLDLGGDKILAYYQDYTEANPFLGLRSIRFSLKNRDIFKAQIRAMLRTSTPSSRVRIMFPMISSLDEFLQAREILMECREELESEGHSIKLPPIGLMIEVPSLVEIMEGLAGTVDFFSIGTNDFVQYMLGVDRGNEKMTDFYLPHHPSVLRALQRVTRIALEYGKEISICGEMAHQERYLPFLLGIGIRVFSMASIYLPQVRDILSRIRIDETEELAAELLQKDSVAEIETFLDQTGALARTGFRSIQS